MRVRTGVRVAIEVHAELQQRVVLFWRERHARPHARPHAHVATAAKGARKRGDAVAGPQALCEVAECEYYGTEAITRDFPFALRLSFFFSRIPYYHRKGGAGGGAREGQSPWLGQHEDRVSYHGFLVALVRARRCETDKEDGVDTKRKRRRKRRLQSGFNETSWGPSNRFRGFSPFATSPSLLSRVENWREKVEQRGLATSVCLCSSSSSPSL